MGSTPIASTMKSGLGTQVSGPLSFVITHFQTHFSVIVPVYWLFFLSSQLQSVPEFGRSFSTWPDAAGVCRMRSRPCGQSPCGGPVEDLKMRSNFQGFSDSSFGFPVVGGKLARCLAPKSLTGVPPFGKHYRRIMTGSFSQPARGHQSGDTCKEPFQVPHSKKERPPVGRSCCVIFYCVRPAGPLWSDCLFEGGLHPSSLPAGCCDFSKLFTALPAGGQRTLS